MVQITTHLPWIQREAPHLSREEIFELLSNKRRRAIIHHLKRVDYRPVTVDDLVEAVANWEFGDTGTGLSDRARASVYSSIMQNHLPRLEEAEVIEYNKTANVVEPTEYTRQIELYLEYSPGKDIPWAEFYLGLSAVAAALVAVVWADIPPFDALPGMVVAYAIVFTLIISSVAHVVQTRRSRLGSEAFERS